MRKRRKIAIVRRYGAWHRLARVGTFGDEFRGILRYFRDHPDWDLAGFGVPLAPAQTIRRWEDIEPGEFAGVIVEGNQTEVVAHCRERGIPVAGINRFECDPGVISICPDDAAIGRLAAEYFLRRGFRSLAFCGPDYVNTRSEQLKGTRVIWIQRRLQSFTEAAEAAGADVSVLNDPAGARHGESNGAAQRRYTRDLRAWVRSLRRPAGILGCADVWAMDCLLACEEEGVQVPQDVAVLGVDNSLFRCEACRPSLSSVDRNMTHAGHLAASLLGDSLTTGRLPANPVLVPPAGIVERLSTDVLAVEDPKLAAALRFARERFRDPISPRDVARNVGMSERQLQRGFERELGFSLAGEVRRLRLEKARELLANTDLPLKSVAELAGFRSESYLCQVFAKEFGVSPGTWRGSSRRTRPHERG